MSELYLYNAIASHSVISDTKLRPTVANMAEQNMEMRSILLEC